MPGRRVNDAREADSSAGKKRLFLAKYTLSTVRRKNRLSVYAMEKNIPAGANIKNQTARRAAADEYDASVIRNRK